MTTTARASKPAPNLRKNAAEVAPRIARRERRREQSRAEIVEAARRVLLRDGIAATTLAAIAKEAGLTKAALYYYYASKDALFFEVVFDAVEDLSQNVHDGVARTETGGAALGAIVRETVRTFAPRMDDFRLAFLHGQVGGPGSVKLAAEQLARLRPLNDLAYGGAAKRLTEERKQHSSRAQVEPRLMAFLANIAAIGLLTMKGMVEHVGDPLLYSDDVMVEAFARIFDAAATR